MKKIILIALLMSCVTETNERSNSTREAYIPTTLVDKFLERPLEERLRLKKELLQIIEEDNIEKFEQMIKDINVPIYDLYFTHRDGGWSLINHILQKGKINIINKFIISAMDKHASYFFEIKVDSGVDPVQNGPLFEIDLSNKYIDWGYILQNRKIDMKCTKDILNRLSYTIMNQSHACLLNLTFLEHTALMLAKSPEQKELLDFLLKRDYVLEPFNEERLFKSYHNNINDVLEDDVKLAIEQHREKYNKYIDIKNRFEEAIEGFNTKSIEKIVEDAKEYNISLKTIKYQNHKNVLHLAIEKYFTIAKNDDEELAKITSLLSAVNIDKKTTIEYIDEIIEKLNEQMDTFVEENSETTNVKKHEIYRDLHFIYTLVKSEMTNIETINKEYISFLDMIREKRDISEGTEYTFYDSIHNTLLIILASISYGQSYDE